MLQPNETSLELELLYKRVEPHLNEIKSKMQSKAKFGEFESRFLKENRKDTENLSPKHSNVRRLTEYRKESVDLKTLDNFWEKSDIILNMDF